MFLHVSVILFTWGGVSKHTSKEEVEGDLAWGVSRPTPRGELRRIWPGGV